MNESIAADGDDGGYYHSFRIILYTFQTRKKNNVLIIVGNEGN
jgi:hypothetical protein